MTIDIHKVITGNPITKNLMKPWGSNKKRTIFNKYTGPGNELKNNFILIHIQEKFIKFMINHLLQMIDVKCIMMWHIQ